MQQLASRVEVFPIPATMFQEIGWERPNVLLNTGEVGADAIQGGLTVELEEGRACETFECLEHESASKGLKRLASVI